jgi:hypothetical protein
MTYTIGETLIYGKSNSNYSLGNGFIQPIGIAPISPPPTSGLVLSPGDIAVYPNPFGTYLMLNGQEESEEKVSVQLIDQQGKLILNEAIEPHNYKSEGRWFKSSRGSRKRMRMSERASFSFLF